MSLASGVRVRIEDAGLMPPMHSYIGREGKTERPEVDGCYVRFADDSYVWCWWAEVVPLDSQPEAPGEAGTVTRPAGPEEPTT